MPAASLKSSRASSDCRAAVSARNAGTTSSAPLSAALQAARHAPTAPARDATAADGPAYELWGSQGAHQRKLAWPASGSVCEAEVLDTRARVCAA